MASSGRPQPGRPQLEGSIWSSDSRKKWWGEVTFNLRVSPALAIDRSVRSFTKADATGRLLPTGGSRQRFDEIRTGNAMVLDPYGEIIAETRATGDAMVVADLDAALLETSSGRRWLRARRPELYSSLTRPTGREQTTRSVRFGE